MKRVALTFLLLCIPFVVMADTIHVPGDQPTIQAGIDAAVDGDIIQVADGIYTGEGNWEIDFQGKNVILMSENGRDHCTIDLDGHWGIRLDSGEGPGAVIQGFTIRDGKAVYPEGDGGAIYCGGGARPSILNNAFFGNFSDGDSGGAVACRNTTLIKGNYFSGNWCDDFGGALYLRGGSSTVVNNVFYYNSARFFGGAIGCWGGSPQIINNLFLGNEQTFSGNEMGGAGIACTSASTATITHCSFAGNIAYGSHGGGAIFVSDSAAVFATNCILWENMPNELGGVYPGTITINYSCISGGWPGTGNLDVDPLFTAGPEGDYYLGQIAAGQVDDSPCVDAGDPLSDLIYGTTRTDLVPDSGIVDMGFHFPFPIARTRLVTGPGPGYDNPPDVHVYVPDHGGLLEYEFIAYGAPHYGTKVTCGDVDGDDTDEILTGPGPGDIYGPHVRGFNRAGDPLSDLNFLAYGTNKYGVNVTTGDLDGDGIDEIITGAGPGAVFGPHVRGWNYDGTGTVTAIPGVSYFAYGTPKWGVNVSAGDIDGDGTDEIITGAGPGAVYGPHVRGWNVDGGSAAAIPGVSFFAYGTLKYGVNVSCGDVDGDGIVEIVTGAGPGAVFAPHVRGWNYDGSSIAPLPGLSFFARNDVRFGANVYAGADLNGDGRAELVVGCGPDPGADTEVKVFTYDGAEVTLWFFLEAYEGMTHGTNVAAGRF